MLHNRHGCSACRVLSALLDLRPFGSLCRVWSARRPARPSPFITSKESPAPGLGLSCRNDAPEALTLAMIPGLTGFPCPRQGVSIRSPEGPAASRCPPGSLDGAACCPFLSWRGLFPPALRLAPASRPVRSLCACAAAYARPYGLGLDASAGVPPGIASLWPPSSRSRAALWRLVTVMPGRRALARPAGSP